MLIWQVIDQEHAELVYRQLDGGTQKAIGDEENHWSV